MHPWVLFVIMPLFALANAGVSLSGDLTAAFMDPVALGIIAGLASAGEADRDRRIFLVGSPGGCDDSSKWRFMALDHGSGLSGWHRFYHVAFYRRTCVC